MGRLLGWLLVAALLGAGGLALWRRFGQPLEVRAGAVERGPVVATVFATGWIEPRERRVLRPPRPAIVERIFAKEGAEVRVGAPLIALRDTARAQRQASVQATLDRLDGDLAEGSALRSAAQARIADAQVQADWTASEVTRAQPLLEQGLLEARAWQELQAARDGAAQRLKLAQEDLAQTLAQLTTRRTQAAAELAVLRAAEEDDTLRAPFDGVVLARFAEEGEAVDPARDVMKFGDVRQLWVEGEVDEEDAVAVVVGQRVLVRVAGDESALVEGTVAELFPDSNKLTRSYRVRVAFPQARFAASGALGLAGTTRAESGRALLVGSSCELGIVIGEKDDALVFPRAALTLRSTVFVLEEGVAHERRVATGLMNYDRCEALTGLAAGDRVAIDHLAALADGTRVRTRVATSGAAAGATAGAAAK
ncbi:MAG: efflux RND transporter periplasmic adaptor subunit [Planctomycetes bacterium]|nr:efflux RND transporter periplasmic adaptor subunit [Planctomycetota bacterium]